MAKNLLGLGLLSVLGVGTVSAEPKSKWTDVPHVASVRATDSNNWVEVDCTLIPDTAPRRATCKVGQVVVRKPELWKSDEEMIAKWSDLATTKKWNTYAQTSCKAMKSESEPKAPGRLAIRKQILAACSAKDPEALASLMLDQWKIHAQTCRVIYAPPFDWEFTQVTADLWTGASNPALQQLPPEAVKAFREANKALKAIGAAPLGPVDCHATTVINLWRKAGDSMWNYSQGRTVPPSSAPECKSLATQTDWVFFDHDPIPLTCKYLGP